MTDDEVIYFKVDVQVTWSHLNGDDAIAQTESDVNKVMPSK